MSLSEKLCDTVLFWWDLDNKITVCQECLEYTSVVYVILISNILFYFYSCAKIRFILYGVCYKCTYLYNLATCGFLSTLNTPDWISFPGFSNAKKIFGRDGLYKHAFSFLSISEGLSYVGNLSH